MAAEDRALDVVTPIVEDLNLELVDLVYGGGRLKVTIDHENGLDTELLTKATRMISHELDLQDPINGTYTLEVSSPGVERPLRTPAHYTRSVGEQVAIKLKPNPENLRRVKGELTHADERSFTVKSDDDSLTLDYDQVAKANTTFDWGPKPKPGKGPSTKNKKPKKTDNSTNTSADGGTSSPSKGPES